jgi:hypothetical protein
MTETYTNDYLCEVIRSHFATNLKKATRDNLLEIIAKNEIEVPVEPEKNPYEIKKDGKTNILVYNGKEYKSDDRFVIRIDHYFDMPNPIPDEGIIIKITPKQVHYQFMYGLDMNTTFRPKTNDFIESFLKHEPPHVYHDD